MIYIISRGSKFFEDNFLELLKNSDIIRSEIEVKEKLKHGDYAIITSSDDGLSGSICQKIAYHNYELPCGNSNTILFTGSFHEIVDIIRKKNIRVLQRVYGKDFFNFIEEMNSNV
jgi:hypothetical protein